MIFSMGDYPDSYGPRRLPLGRFAIAGVIALVSLVSYYGKRSVNPVTNEVQHVNMSLKQEVAIGLQAAPEMAAQFGGLSDDMHGRELVEHVGRKLLAAGELAKAEYPFKFHLLADPRTINA